MYFFFLYCMDVKAIFDTKRIIHISLWIFLFQQHFLADELHLSVMYLEATKAAKQVARVNTVAKM